MNNYKKLKNTYLGTKLYNLNGINCNENKITEEYSGPVTLSLPEWNLYVSEGKNVLYGSGGVIPGGTFNTPFGGGSVYKGNISRINQFI